MARPMWAGTLLSFGGGSARALVHHLERGTALQRMTTVQRVVQRNAIAELIGARVGVFAEKLFGRHEPRGAEHGAGGGQRCVQCAHCMGWAYRVMIRCWRIGPHHGAREPKVTNANPAVRADQHVVGFEVTMQKPYGVRGGQAATRLQHDLEHVAPRPFPPSHPLRHRVAFDKFHGDIDFALARRIRTVDRADVIDGDHVGMRQLRNRLSFANQPRARLTGGDANAGAQQLDRDLTIELRIVGGEHDAHAASAQPSEHQIAADAIADGDLRIARIRRRISRCADDARNVMMPR